MNVKLTRRMRTEILVESDPGIAQGLAELVEHEAPVSVLTAPHQGLVMCQVRETARNSRFYLGEVLVTECRVDVAGEEGLGVVVGTDAAHARALAVVDAAFSQKAPLACQEELERRIFAAGDALAVRRREDDARIYVSRVEFDEMSGQDMSVQAVVK